MFAKIFFIPSVLYGTSLALVLALTVSAGVFAQDTLYFDQYFDPVKDRAAARFLEVRKFEPTDTNKCIVLTLFANGNSISVVRYSNYSKGERNGRSIFWFESGQLCSEIPFVNGNRQGKEKNFYPNGQLQSQITWDQDTIVSGAFFNEDGSPKTVVYQEDFLGTKLLERPSFPGGEMEMLVYLSQSLRYPEKSRRSNEEGIVLMSFVVEKNGTISEVKVVESVTPLLDAEAMRVVKSMPRWTPGTVNGLPARVRFKLPIRFRLE